jgi:hypothetical protein
MTLSKVTKQLSWFWSLEGIECFDCVFGVFAFALVLNVKKWKLGWLEWRWLGGGIYSLQPLPSRWLSLLSMVTPDSPVVHRTWHCSLSDACHVSRLLRFRAVDRWSPLSFCDIGQSDAFWLCSSDFRLLLCALFTRQCSRPLEKLTIAPLAHRTVRWHTG